MNTYHLDENILLSALEKNCSIEMQLCQLCGQEISDATAISHNDLNFCCYGCLTVFKVLEKQNRLEGARSSTLFLEALRLNIISNPSLLKQLERKIDLSGSASERAYLEICDMWCGSCSDVIRLVLSQVKGVNSCSVDYATDIAVIAYDPQAIGLEQITQNICFLGYSVKKLSDNASYAVTKKTWLRFIISSCLALNVMMLAYPIYASNGGKEAATHFFFAAISFFLSIPVLTWCGLPIFRRAFNALLVGIISMEALVTLSVFAATVLSIYALYCGSSKVYFDSATVLISLILLGKILESKAKISSKKTVELLCRFIPKRCKKINFSGKVEVIALKEVVLGDKLVITFGEKVPLDGVVIEGEALVDESLITGEPMPYLKKRGDGVVAASALIQGNITITVTSDIKASLFHTIVETSKSSLDDKIISKKTVDTIIPYFVLSVLLIALVCLIILADANAFLTVLMISCPCAVGIAAPMAESQLIHVLASNGVLIRNRAVIDKIGKETIWVCDKTGTVTTGQFQIISELNNLKAVEKSVLKAMAQRSSHPICAAINTALDAEPVVLESFKENPGRGIISYYKGISFYLGSKRFMLENKCVLPTASKKNSAETRVYFAYQNFCEEIVLADEIRPQARSFISSLKLKTILLSGDSLEATEKVAKSCLFSEYYGGVLPQEKYEFIKKLRSSNEIICMVGDGINDAMALSTAHIAISMADATDISRNVSDIVLANNNWKSLENLRAQALKTQKIIRQNIFWAFFYNCAAIPLAALGYLSPLIAAIAMTASSLMIVANTQRIR